MHDPLLALAARLGGGPVEVKETHISRVALAGEPGAGGVVLKQCKPVDFGFVDLRTRPRRRAALEKEHAVNARFAPGVYRGVRDLPGGEPVLEMARLNEADTLEAKVRRGEATSDDLTAVLDHLLPLFEASERTPRWGDPAVIRRNLTENLEVLEAAESRSGREPMWAANLRAAQLGFLSLHEPELRGRAGGGFVRDGHGDLRAEHIYLTADGIKVLDGIAFSDRLRCVDVADEVAFLAYSLDQVVPPTLPYRRHPSGDDLLRRYRRRAGDPVSDELLAFYRGYRAAVRGKVAALGQPADPPHGADGWFSDLSEALTSATLYYVTNLLVAVGGRSGSGKSTLAAAVAERIGAIHLRSDAIRKERAGVAADEPAPPSAYDRGETEAVYAALTGRAVRAAIESGAAVADATFLNVDHRRRLAAAVEAVPEGLDVTALFVWCECDEEVAAARLAARAAVGADASDADLAVRRRQAVGLGGEELEEFEHVLRLDTNAPVDELCGRVIDALGRLVRRSRNRRPRCRVRRRAIGFRVPAVRPSGRRPRSPPRPRPASAGLCPTRSPTRRPRRPPAPRKADGRTGGSPAAAASRGARAARGPTPR